MKKNNTIKSIKQVNSLFLIILLLLLTNCVGTSVHNTVIEERDKLIKQVDSLNDVITYLNKKNLNLSDSIKILSFPAEQRFFEIEQLIKNNELDKALIRIKQLQQIFPNSEEASKLPNQISIIEKKKEAIKEEENRRKALGFKIFKDQSQIIINKDNDIVKCTFSNFHFGKDFEFDYIQDVNEYSYRDADKDLTYILADLSISTNLKYAYPPEIFACEISDGKLKRICWFSHEYATWETYGAYIGNYSESSHDFSKVNTVHYKLGGLISQKEAKLPIVILMAKNNDTKKIKNLLIEGLEIEDANKYCDIIKIINRNKIN